jgi:hypothetical protein
VFPFLNIEGVFFPEVPSRLPKACTCL